MIYATLTGTKVTDADLAVLTGLSDLKHLTLTGTRITGEGLDRLTGLTNWHLSTSTRPKWPMRLWTT